MIVLQCQTSAWKLQQKDGYRNRDCNRVKVHEEQESNQKTHQSDEGEAQVQQAEKEQTECLNKDVNSQNR